MEEFTLRDLQKAEYYMLCALEKICEEIGIKVALGWGSLLGAIRHKGFIPWDDDIDVMITDKDYRKLKNHFKKHGGHINGLFLADSVTDSETIHCLPRLRLDGSAVEEYATDGLNIHKGLWIDIFVYCGCAENKWLRRMQDFLLGNVFMLHEKFLNRQKRLNNVEVANVPIYKLGEKMPESLRVWLIRFMLFLIRLCGAFGKSENMYNMCMYVKYRAFPRKFLADTIKAPFESGEHNIAKDYDESLTMSFGKDYMTPVVYHSHFRLDTVKLDTAVKEKIDAFCAEKGIE